MKKSSSYFDKQYAAIKKELQTELDKLEKGKTETIGLDELDKHLEAAIRKS